MAKNRFTVDELIEELRMKGFTDISTVKYAILETNGRLSVLPYADQLPVTARQMAVASDELGLPVVIINDGRVLERNLKSRGLNGEWLEKRLVEHDVRSPQDVYLLTVDEQNRVYFVVKDVRAG